MTVRGLVAGDLVEIEGKTYVLVSTALMRCENCTRITTTGLCGCPSPQPIKEGDSFMGMPVATPGAAS